MKLFKVIPDSHRTQFSAIKVAFGYSGLHLFLPDSPLLGAWPIRQLSGAATEETAIKRKTPVVAFANCAG